MRLAASRAGIVLSLYVAIVGCLWLMQDLLIHPGWTGPTVDMVSAIPDLREVSVPGADAGLRGWFRPPGEDRPFLVIFHGNGGFHWDKLRAFAARDWGVLLVAYRGYADNPGRPTEAGLMADARAILGYTTERLDISSDRIVLYGESLGSGVAARMAITPGEWRALILVSGYTSVEDRAAERFPWVPVRLLLRDRFATTDVIGQVRAPILILHGTEDRVIPISHGHALARLAPDPAEAAWIEGGRHVLPSDRVAAEVDAFLGTQP